MIHCIVNQSNNSVRDHERALLTFILRYVVKFRCQIKNIPFLRSSIVTCQSESENTKRNNL